MPSDFARTTFALLTITLAAAVACGAGEKMDIAREGTSASAWADGSLVGQPVDIAPWAYLWRADRAVQPTPEACFIPRRLDRIDKVYRTAYYEMPEQDLKSIHYNMPDLLKPLLPKPKGGLQTGLLWTGGLVDYRVELQWPTDAKTPSPDQVEVRSYPTSFGWFGWTVDRVLAGPEVSADGCTWTYKSDPKDVMDSSYNGRVPAATEMVAVFCQNDKQYVPTLRVIGPNIGNWKRMDVEVEWGFDAKQADFEGHLEPYVAKIGPVTPISGDFGTAMTGDLAWRSHASGDGRRGIRFPLLYAPDSRPGLDSRVTLWSKSGGFTFRISDLEHGSIYVPQQGVFVTRVGSGETAREYVDKLAAKRQQSVQTMTREHREAASWDELMKEVRLWNCPAGTDVPPFKEVQDPQMQVRLSDERWTAAWRSASAQLQGENLWGGLAFEVGRVAHDMDMIGLHKEADKIYDHFLKAPGAKCDGDFSDGRGALELASSMRHDMGYSHDGTHPSTGRVLFALAERYFLTGDRQWLASNRARMTAAADWIIRQRRSYMEDVPNRKDLFVAGLMPPHMLGDYALPASDWHWYYVNEALSLQGLQRFADALATIDPQAGRKYQDEARAYRDDLRRAVDRETVLSPVRLGHDGAYHSYIPRMAYARGLTGPELGAPQYPDCDRWIGSLALAEPFALMDAKDPRMVDTLEVMEEMGTSPSIVGAKEAARKQKGLPTADTWFWNCFAELPKASHNANIYLLQDDVPNFLRFWTNCYASIVGADGRLWEHTHPDSYAECDTPDNGTAGWFMENFRDMLVMEDGGSLWIARATPRSWLEQGKRISVSNAPTYFGKLAYEIESDIDHGKISARLHIPSRSPIKSVILRLRHPKAARIKSVTVNGRNWRDFDAGKEVVKLTGVSGKVDVDVSY